jgi:hypothetical protein
LNVAITIVEYFWIQKIHRYLPNLIIGSNGFLLLVGNSSTPFLKKSIFCNGSPIEIVDRITGPPSPSRDQDGIGRRDIKKSFTFRYYSSDTGYWLLMLLKSGLGQG